MNSPAQKIKERLPIEEVVSSYIKVEKAGANLKARCPFHNEKTPSFFISPERGSYYCFGCGASGDIFTFVEEFEGLDFKGALKLLADRAGVVLESYNKEEESEKDRLYKVMEAATIFFQSNLNNNPKAIEYLKSRGLKDETIQNFRVGFAHPEWRELHDKLSDSFTKIELERAGLIKINEGKIYDRFRGRIMFPINDSSGRVIAFSGRIFVDDGKSAKYLNSPETPIFSKHLVLFGLDKAKDSIRKNNFSILVEGQMDLILSHQAGYKNTVATSGTALSDTTLSKDNIVSNLGLVRRLSPNIVLAYDADKAGLAATARSGRIALSLGMDVKIAALPPDVDPADLILKGGSEAWKGAIKNSKHLIEFMLAKVMENNGRDARKAGREIKASVLPFVNALDSAIEKMHFLKKISDMTGIPESALKDDLKKVEGEAKQEGMKEDPLEDKVEHRRDNILRKLMGIILWQKNKEEKSIDFEGSLGELARILKIPPKDVINTMKGREEDLIFEAEVFYGGRSDVGNEVVELLYNLEEEILKEELDNKMRDLRAAEDEKNFEKSAELLIQCKAINDEIQNIKNKRSTKNKIK